MFVTSFSLLSSSSNFVHGMYFQRGCMHHTHTCSWADAREGHFVNLSARCTADTDIMRILYCALSSRPSPHVRLNVNGMLLARFIQIQILEEGVGGLKQIRSSYSIHLGSRSKNRVWKIVSFTTTMSFQIYSHHH